MSPQHYSRKGKNAQRCFRELCLLSKGRYAIIVYDMTKPMDADLLVVCAGSIGSNTASVFRRSSFVVLL